MRVCVVGLGHLGTVTAACISADGHKVVGLDADEGVVARLRSGEPPVVEPGLPELLAAHPPTFTTDPAAAVAGADVVWLADDTPIDENDAADVGWVLERARVALEATADGVLVVVSSQLPTGTVRMLEAEYPKLRFVCIPENVRLGHAVATFCEPERVIVGTRDPEARDIVAELLGPVRDGIIWMSIESAEVAKHALNAFLATSVAFANELAGICEVTGADMREVEAALRSDSRVGERAYVAPGPPFGGGTLARDVEYLRALGRAKAQPTSLLDGVVRANEAHRGWLRRHLEAADPRVTAVWGIAYKPGTESTRRSEAVNLCVWLVERGVEVRVHDPLVRAVPEDLAGAVDAVGDPVEAVRGADTLVVAVAWPEYADVSADAVAAAMSRAVVLDPSGMTAKTLGRHPEVVYATVGIGL